MIREIKQPFFRAAPRDFFSIYEEKTTFIQQVSLAVEPQAAFRCGADKTGFVERPLRRIEDDARLGFAKVRAEERRNILLIPSDPSKDCANPFNKRRRQLGRTFDGGLPRIAVKCAGRARRLSSALAGLGAGAQR